MFKFISSLFRRWSLDRHESLFLKKARRPTAKTMSCVIVQMPPNYFYLCLFSMAVAQVFDDKKLLGLWPSNVMSAPRDDRLQSLRRVARHIINWFEFNKWRKLYRGIGVGDCYSLKVGPVTMVKNSRIAHRIWVGLNNKEDVLSLVLNGTHCGDLIYDTYLRFRVQSTVDVKDPYLKTIITQALNAQYAIRRLLRKKVVDGLLTSYSSYVQHGIPVREALHAGVKVYSAANLSHYFKQLGPKDPLHVWAYWDYKSKFHTLSEPEIAKELAREHLDKRFQGKLDLATTYMKTSAYAANDIGMPPAIEGVVFLHDFFDSPHCYRNMLFPDFWEWAKFTLQVIESENLPIAIKPHPNQLPESQMVVEQLKSLFPRVVWLDQKISNKTILTSGIRCGISVYGTILHELVYQGIPALAAGDHPHVAFDIAKTPTSIEEYLSYLVNFRSLVLPDNFQDEVLSFYYMHNIYDKEDLPVDFGQMNLRCLDPNNSIALSHFIAMMESEHVTKAMGTHAGGCL